MTVVSVRGTGLRWLSAIAALVIVVSGAATSADRSAGAASVTSGPDLALGREPITRAAVAFGTHRLATGSPQPSVLDEPRLVHLAGTTGYSEAPPAAPPSRLRVDTLAIDAPVSPLGLTGAGRLEVPTEPDEVGWWSGGARPGAPGPAVLVGHVDWTDGPAVFHGLERLDPGDSIVITDEEDRRHRFEVVRVEVHPKHEFPTSSVYGPTAEPALRLITCGGRFDTRAGHYDHNVIVYADAVAPPRLATRTSVLSLPFLSPSTSGGSHGAS